MPRHKSPTRRRMHRAEVTRTERTSPSFVTLTIQGPDLADFDPMGFDQACRLFFRRDGQRELAMPTASHNGWLAQFMLMRPATRPWVRLYTVRAFRPEAREMDIEFVLHGDHADAGPASAFASHARPGDPVGLFPEGIGYLPTPTAQSQLLVGDESAVPALLSILEQSPPDLTGDAYLEVPTSRDIRPVAAPPESPSTGCPATTTPPSRDNGPGKRSRPPGRSPRGSASTAGWRARAAFPQVCGATWSRTRASRSPTSPSSATGSTARAATAERYPPMHACAVPPRAALPHLCMYGNSSNGAA